MSLRRPSILALLVGANTAVIVLPLLAVLGLRIYDHFLLRQTERELIAQSVVIAEAFRDAHARELGRAPGDHRPRTDRDEPYLRVEPRLDLGLTVLPAQPLSFPAAPPGDTPARRAGRSVEPLLRRAQTFNLSAIRILDEAGCVVATTRSEAGVCMHALPEVRDALRGRYTAVARARVSDEPPPPLGDIRRRGTERIFTALPVFEDGRLIAVVRASRTGLDAVSTLWANRRGLVLSLVGLAVLGFAVSFGFSAAIARPLRRLTVTARAVASGGSSAALAPRGFAPSEVVVLAEVLASMTEQLERRATYVAEFASNASHELKTPITAVRGAAELLHQHWAEMEPAQRERFLANIVDDAQRMERLVTRMLELARIENTAGDAVASVELAPFVRQLVARYGAQVSLDLDDAPASIDIAEQHLHSVLTNLLDNAVRHGEGRPVTLRLRRAGERLCIEVADQGSGISPANQARLFQRFFTTERDRGGTGLGLAIVKAIAEARGGRVEMLPRSDGSTFKVLL